MGKTIAPTVPMTVTIKATCLPLNLGAMVSAEIPALQASRKVVVTVENTTISRPTTPRPACSRIWAISLWPV